MCSSWPFGWVYCMLTFSWDPWRCGKLILVVHAKTCQRSSHLKHKVDSEAVILQNVIQMIGHYSCAIILQKVLVADLLECSHSPQLYVMIMNCNRIIILQPKLVKCVCGYYTYSVPIFFFFSLWTKSFQLNQPHLVYVVKEDDENADGHCGTSYQLMYTAG